MENSASISIMHISLATKNLSDTDNFIEKHPPAKIIFKKNNVPKTLIYIIEIALVMNQSPFKILFDTFDTGLRKTKEKWVQNHLGEIETRYGVKSDVIGTYPQSKVLSVIHFWIDTFNIQSIFHNRNYVVSLLLSDLQNFSNLDVVERVVPRKLEDYTPHLNSLWVYRSREPGFRRYHYHCENHHSCDSPNPDTDCAIFRAFLITCLAYETDKFLDALLEN
jgi:hypothetical protein